VRELLWSVTALILSFSMLLAGNSLQFVILALRAGMEGFSPEMLGWITAAYFAGFALGSLYCPRLVASAGHIRTFAAMASIISGVTLAHPLLVDPVAWAAMRVVIGFCFAGLYLVVESWLNDRAGNAQRGRLLAIYGVAAFAGYGTGPLLSRLGSAEGFVLFVVASMLVSFALVPVTLTRASAPVMGDPSRSGRTGILSLFRLTPLGVLAIVAVGACQGAFLGLGPVFADRMGASAAGVANYMSIVLFAGLCFQYPLGWLSDRLDRRHVIAGVAGFAAISAFGIAFLAASDRLSPALMTAGAVLTGATLFPVYAIVLAHTNDWLDEHQRVSAAATLILLYSLGSMVGSPVASWLTGILGTAGLHTFFAVVMGVVGLFAIYRGLQREAPESTGEYSMALQAASPGTLPMEASFDTGVVAVDNESKPPPPAN
jgi:MFS family permease